jgi:pyruvate formate lyase activating enzyme
MIPIKGLQRTSAIDYPGVVSCVVFIAGCNFRCPFCHNPDLVETPKTRLDIISEKSLLDFLSKRKQWLDGVVITGGEPTLYRELPSLIKRIKSLDYLIKLDTNGSNPDMLVSLLEEGLLNFISMDIKAPLDKYENVANARVDKSAIERSVNIIRESGIGYEFRTTVLPILHSDSDLREIGKWLEGSERYAIQQFRPNVTLDKSFGKEKPYSAGELSMFAEDLKPFFGKVEVRI